MKKFLVFLCSVSFLLAGCDSFEAYRSRTIGVRVTAGETKGTVTTTSSITKAGAFCMCSYVADQYFVGEGEPLGEPGIYFGSLDATSANVVQNAGAWEISGAPTWIDGVTMRFWSWYPVSVIGTRTISGPVDGGGAGSFAGDTLAFSYALPTADGVSDADDAASEDLLFAFTKADYDEDNTSIDVTFHHALAQVRFCVSVNDGTFDAHSLGIKNISITNLATSGSCKFSDDGLAANNSYSFNTGEDSYDQFVWTGQSGSATIGQDYDVADFLSSTLTGWASGSYSKDGHSYSLLTNTNVFFMIPQTLSGNTGAADDNKISIDFIFGEDTITKTVTLPGDTWRADHYYTYKIKATTVGRDIDMSINLVGWSDRDDKLFI